MHTILLNCLLIAALLLGNVAPLAAAALSAPIPASAPVPVSNREPASEVEPALPMEAEAVAAFAPYAYWQRSTDAYVSVPYDAGLLPQDGATFEAWVFLPSISGCHSIFSTGYSQGYWVGVCNGRIRYASGAVATYTEGTTVILPNVWTHIAVVWDPGLTVRRFFINGDFDVLAPAGAAPTGNQELRIGGAIPSDTLLGFLAEARIWSVARDQSDIRRTLNSYIDEKLPGLVAAFPFSRDLNDVIGGRAGTAHGTQQGIFFVGTDAVHPFPLRPATVVADEAYNVLPHRRDSAAWVYLPNLDRTLLIGGNVNGAESNRIDAIAGGTGDFSALGSLPVGLLQSAAAYAPESGKVYLFGGSSGAVGQNGIYAIDPATGVTTLLAALLPEAARGAAAVYHPGLHKIFVLGGVTDDGARLNRVSVFDPISENLTPAAFSLPVGVSWAAAAYSAATDRIYTFGGISPGGSTDAIYELLASGDGTAGRVVPVSVTLGAADSGLVAVEDRQTQLIYLMGGGVSDRVWAFDPVLDQIWQTPSELPGRRFQPAALYSPANRHALLIGGFENGLGQTNVWKFALGDGPAVKLGRWESEYASGTVNAISAAADRVIVGTTSGATARSDGGTTVYGPGDLGGANVRQVQYDVARGRIYFVVDTNRIVYDPGSGIVKLWPNSTETDRVLDFNPYGNSPVIATAVDTNVPQGYGSLLWRWGLGSDKFWHASWKGCYFSSGLVNRAPNEIWGLVTQSTCGPRSAGPEPRQADAPGDVYMQGLTYSSVTGQFSEFDYDKICSDGAFVPNRMAFGQNGDFWAAGSTGVCRYPAATIPGTFGVQWKYNVMNTPTGPSTTGPSVDQDGRVWFGVNNDATHSGGLTVFGVKGKDPNRQSVWTTDYTWLNAPIGSKNGSGPADYNSSVGALFANGERVWSARGSQIFTLAQRWQQLDEHNSVQDKALTGIWTVRGRLFVATADELSVLQPDGITWENWALAGVKAVVADKDGRIWVGGADGVALYTGPTGFQPVPSPTDPPAGPITALAVDTTGRLWIGSAAGVTLYDRGRFVTTLAPATGGAVRSLLADRDEMLWVGTDAGLNRFSMADAAWTGFTTADGLPTNDIGDVVQLPNGWLAIAHSLGVVQYRGGTTFVGYSISGNKLPLSVDDKGRLWAGGSMVDGNAWQSYTWANSGLRANAVADNAADGADRVWFAHPGGGISVRGSTLPPLAEQVPLISGITPTSGSARSDIHILGSGFGADRSAVSVQIGGKPVEIISVTDGDVTVRLGPDNTSGQVSLTKNRKRTTTASDLFCAIPVITGVTPSGGTIGVEMAVTGTNFDPGATITLGGPAHRPYPASTQRLTTRIEASDAYGSVRVQNNCATSSDWPIPFNRIDLTIDRLVLNQGLPDQPLLYARPTLVQNFLRRNAEIRPGDRVEIDAATITFTDPRNGAVYTQSYRNVPAVPTSSGPTSESLLADTSNSLNVANVVPIGGAGFVAGNLQMTVELKNKGLRVTQTERTVRFERNVPLRVVLVPIMDKGRGANLGNVLQTMKTNTDRNLDDLRRRMLPTGDVEFVWSDDVLVHDEKIELDDFIELYHFGPQLDRARSRWNDRTHSDALMAFGVVDPMLVSGNASGYGFWPDASELANTLLLDALDTLCDVGNTVVNTVSFGLLGSDDGCHLDITLYIAWAKGDDGVLPNPDVNGMNSLAQSSFLFAHEMGHSLGLVKPWAYNGSVNDNLSHSVNDEIGPLGDLTTASKSCAQRNDPGAFFDWRLSFYNQPGVRLPVVNPISGGQLRPQNDGKVFGPRAKAMMSYACAQYNYNAFFEPVDEAQIRATIDHAGTVVVGAQRNGDQVAPTPKARTIEGERLHVAGTVNRDEESGLFSRVEKLTADASLSPSFDTGYWLVQVDGGGAELARLGVYPLFAVVHKHNDHTPQPPSPVGFYAATLLKATGLARLELRHGDQVLDTFAPGGAAPEVSLSSPVVGPTSLEMAWTTSDVDGDALEVAVDYSADGGTTWKPVGSATGPGPGGTTIPLLLLAGGADARVRVTASDGFQTASATSDAFIIAPQPPRVYISQPLPAASLSEGELVQLSGGATDNQDGALSGDSLAWRSDRDGDLGAGEALGVELSVGTHRLTLRAVNGDGLTAETSVTVTVAGDYDGDTILDTVEAAENLNPLTSADALSDEDGDGLSLRVERNWGTLPTVADSDGDGRNDGDEIVNNTDPTTNDSPQAPDALVVTPAGLKFTVDLSADTLPAQQSLQIVSRDPLSWTLSLGAGWLQSAAASGMTPAASTIWIQPAALADGVYTSSLLVGSPIGEVRVPITVTVSHKSDYCDANRDGITDQADISEVSGRVGSQAGEAAYYYAADLNRDGVINQQDVALVTACLAAAPTHRLFLPAVRRQSTGQPDRLLIYGDELAGGWEDWSWDSVVDFASNGQVKVGAKAMAVTHTQANGGLALRSATVFNGGRTSAIRFWIFGNGEPLALYTQPTDDGTASSVYPFTPAAGVWTQIQIPLNALGSPVGIQRINVQDESGAAQGVYFLDELEIVEK